MDRSVSSVALLVLLGAVGFIAWRVSQDAQGAGRSVGGALVNGADGVIQGAVETVGGVMGIPLTDAAACRQAIADGDTWTASFVCPAKDFFASTWTKIKTDTAGLPNLTTTADGMQYDQMGNVIGHTRPTFTGGATGGW